MRQELIPLHKELRSYFGVNGGQKSLDKARLARKEEVEKYMDAFAAENPHASPLALRKKLYEKISEKHEVILFPDSPFYNGIEGNGGWNCSSASLWLLVHQEMPFRREAVEDIERFTIARQECFFLSSNFFTDLAHHAPPIPLVLKNGFKGIRENAAGLLSQDISSEEREYVTALIAGLDAVKVIQEKYRKKALEYLEKGNLSPRQKKFMQMIAESAARSPWEKPETFYEALNTCAFVREIMGELDGLRTNSYGRVDAWLVSYYEKDLEEGRITEEEAYDLICRFLLAADSLYDHDSTVEQYSFLFTCCSSLSWVFP